jgi:hypothetical protein
MKTNNSTTEARVGGVARAATGSGSTPVVPAVEKPSINSKLFPFRFGKIVGDRTLPITSYRLLITGAKVQVQYMGNTNGSEHR